MQTGTAGHALLVSTPSMSYATHRPSLSHMVESHCAARSMHSTYKNKFGSPGATVLLCSAQGKCTFAARLTDEEVQQLTRFVLERAAAGWK